MARLDTHEKTEGEKSELLAAGHVKEALADVEVIQVTLSERNLLSLLAKLYIDGSKRTIYNGDVPSGQILKLVAEHDDVHYASESRGYAQGYAGAMAGPTEGLVAALKKTLEQYERNTKVVDLFRKGAAEARGDQPEAS